MNTRLVKEIIEEQRQAGKAILMSTHQMYQVEALCNRIILINQGRTVLYGTVDEIKHSFAGNAIRIVGQGDFTQLPGVLDTRNTNGSWQLALQPGTDPQSVLLALAGRQNIKIERFELAEPSLDDIFVNVVGGNKSQEAEHE